MRGAWQQDTNLVEANARITAEQLAAKSETRAGPPYVEYQREGIDSSFGNALNSTRYLRIGKPFNAPWQWSTGRAMVSATEAYAATARQAAAMEIAHKVGLAWLRLAALNEHEAVQQVKLQRGRQALELHRKRLEMGEVSGSEVSQLELEHARQASALAALRARREQARLELEGLAGKGDFNPVRGDLARLTAELEPLPGDEAWLVERLEESLFMRVARQQTEQGRRSADLEQKLAWGRPEIEVEWEHVPSVEGLDDYDAFGWRIQLPLPVDRSGRERRQASRANLAAVEAQERILKRELEARVRAAAAAAAAAEERMQLMEGVLARLPETERSFSEQFRLGAIHYMVYFDALSRLEEVLLQSIEARQELLEARLELAVTLDDRSLFPLPEPGPEDVR